MMTADSRIGNGPRWAGSASIRTATPPFAEASVESNSDTSGVSTGTGPPDLIAFQSMPAGASSAPVALTQSAAAPGSCARAAGVMLRSATASATARPPRRGNSKGDMIRTRQKQELSDDAEIVYARCDREQEPAE